MRISRCDKREHLRLGVACSEVARYLLIRIDKLTVCSLLCLINKRLYNRTLTSCTAEIAVVVAMTDSAVNKSLLTVQLCRTVREVSLRRRSSDIIRFIVLNINRNAADCVNYFRERLEINHYILVNFYFIIVFNGL